MKKKTKELETNKSYIILNLSGYLKIWLIDVQVVGVPLYYAKTNAGDNISRTY